MEVDINNDDAPITGTIKGVFNIYGGDFPNMIDDIDDERVRIIK